VSTRPKTSSKASETAQVDAAFGPPIDTEPARAATFEVRGAADQFSRVVLANTPKGRHLNKALQLVEMAFAMARQGIETTPPAA